jgi:hypothetical protein
MALLDRSLSSRETITWLSPVADFPFERRTICRGDTRGLLSMEKPAAAQSGPAFSLREKVQRSTNGTLLVEGGSVVMP